MASSWFRKLKRKPALIGSVLVFVLSLGLATYASITLAWFSTTRTATVNFASMQVEGGLEASTKYCSYNQESSGNGGYSKDGLTASKLTSDNKTYAQLFLSSTGADDLGTGYFAPKYCSSYVIEVSNPTSHPINFGTYLVAYNETVLATKVDGDNLTPASYISLARAMRVYTAYSLSTGADLLTASRTFLSSSFSSSGTENAGVFSHTEAVTATGTPKVFNLTTPESWNPGGTSIALSSGATCYFFISIYFSNDSSTFYSETSSVTENNVTTTTYNKSTSGNSNCYTGLSIAFTSILVSPDEA